MEGFHQVMIKALDHTHPCFPSSSNDLISTQHYEDIHKSIFAASIYLREKGMTSYFVHTSLKNAGSEEWNFGN